MSARCVQPPLSSAINPCASRPLIGWSPARAAGTHPLEEPARIIVHAVSRAAAGRCRGRGGHSDDRSRLVNHLLRSHAPISDVGWKLLDEEARQRLAPALAARRLVDFSGPLGWEHSATNLGRTSPLKSPPGKGVTGLQRKVLALIEVRADF